MNPTDSYLWLKFYLLEIGRSGFDASIVGYLDKSYTAGPLEGWIALQRNIIAISVFRNLSDEMQARVVLEFGALVDSKFTDAAALNLIGTSPEIRVLLASGLESVELVEREALAKKIAREGMKVDIPGVQVDERLWHQ